MYLNGQVIFEDGHFNDHIEYQVPVQIYCGKQHSDIGFIEQFTSKFVRINNIFYNRNLFTFISRPGY